MTTVRIATRRSALALHQAHLVGGMLQAGEPGLSVEFVEVATTGDLDRVSPVATLTEVGAFVRAVQRAVLDGAADLAVHSCKDLPVTGPGQLVQFYPDRAAPWDVLCGARLADLDEGAVVGTGSPRRRSQLLRLRPDLDVREIRGNVDTRLRAVEDGTYAAVVLAEAGLERLGRTDAIAHRFDVSEMVPAPAQAALAVEVPAAGPFVEMVESIADAEVSVAVAAERELLARTGAGCRSALGALATPIPTGEIAMVGFVDDADGTRRASVTGAPGDVAALLQRELAL
jgi:hydroxymethylbilane synthase